MHATGKSYDLLELAQRALLAEAAVALDQGDYDRGRMLEQAHDVTDHTRRVSGHWHDAFYCAEKSGVLLRAAALLWGSAAEHTAGESSELSDARDELLRAIETAQQKAWEIQRSSER